jgi:Ni,Fe-hydrogenase I cytochrome b subunit
MDAYPEPGLCAIYILRFTGFYIEYQYITVNFITTNQSVQFTVGTVITRAYYYEKRLIHISLQLDKPGSKCAPKAYLRG